MKKFLSYLFVFGSMISLNAQTLTITEASGWTEAAFVKWSPVAGADSYKVYYTGGGQTDKIIDKELIRSYGSYFRADIPGLAPGSYTIKVVPVTASVEGASATTANLTVLAQDRTGFAFDSGRLPGAYKADGTPKTGAIILYITQNTKNTLSMNITGASANPCVGFQNILYAIKKGKETRPFIFRLIGNITDMNVMEGGDITIENANNPSSYLTIEGVGSDAVVNGMGIRLKAASNIEISNLGFMNCNSTAGDNVGMQQDNDHIWVHNCDMFYGDAGSAADQVKGDGALDNKTSTYCTFSYNHFWDNGKCSLLGLSENKTSGLYVTYHHNWFDHSDSRHPRVRFYSAHVYNNYFDGNSKYGVGSTMGSSVFVEGNYFRDCKHPMMISLQGTDISSGLVNATFSGEEGGMIKAFNNTFDADNGANSMRFVAYADPNPTYNNSVLNSTIDFDAYLAATRGESVPATVLAKVSYKVNAIAQPYNNFDTDAAFYVKDLVIDAPAVARDKIKNFAGRVSGGDLKFTYTNAIDDVSSTVNAVEKAAVTNYTSAMIFVQGEVVAPPASSQTLITSTDNNQTVIANAAINPMIFTWGGDATDLTINGLPASGIAYSIDAPNKTITISGTPTANLSFTLTTIGTSGSPTTSRGTITIAGTTPNDEVHNFTTSGKTSTFYTIIGNMSSSTGSTTFNGVTLTARLKMESSTSISYTTATVSTLTLIFDPTFTGTVKLDGIAHAAVAGIVIITDISAGSHTIIKGSSANLFYIKTVFTTDALGIIQQALSHAISIYPNPVTNTLNIATNALIRKISIYNSLGVLVKEADGDHRAINMDNLSSGNYFLKISSDQETIIKQILKK